MTGVNSLAQGIEGVDVSTGEELPEGESWRQFVLGSAGLVVTVAPVLKAAGSSLGAADDAARLGSPPADDAAALAGKNAETAACTAAEVAPNKVPPLADVLEGHSAQQGFTGVIDSATGKVLLKPSRLGSDLPPGWVSRRGGHADVSRAVGGNAANHRGFAVILQEDGTLKVTWGSGVLNPPPDFVVPVELRRSIVDAIEAATGRTVSSF